MKLNIKETVALLNERDISDLEISYNQEIINELNHEQRVAATRIDGNYLVIAGPGSGKTHTLAYRVLYLVRNNVDPQSIVVITFTRKSANELKSRIEKMLPNTSIGYVGTFHGFSHFLSTKLGNASPLSGLRLLDSEDDVQVHKLVMADFENFKVKIRAKKLQKIISYCANAQMNIKEYIDTFDLNDLKSEVERLRRYREAYEKYKADHQLASYDDMIQQVTKYLRGNENIKITSLFDYLMIDEYQDTNQMQLDFIRELKMNNVMAIGDDFQGIYAFRGADHRIILNFANDFKDAKMIKLKDNYRSTGKIVDYINKTVAGSNVGYHKQFRVVKEEEGIAEVISGFSLEDHKKFILDQIEKEPNKKHALIYRYNKHRTEYEKLLIEKEIAYSVYGGIRLLERKHIKDVLAFLMVYLNNLDIVSFNRILMILPGVGPKTARKLIDNNLQNASFINPRNGVYLEKIRNILDSRVAKEVLYKNICDFYFEIFEHIESEYYTKEEIMDDFKLIKELLKSYDALDNFIIQLILDPVVDMNKGDKPNVVLTTIHSAKGLEFDYVYYFHTHDWFNNFDVDRLEEDRRLFYVGISRAKEKLWIIDHSQYARNFKQILRDFDNASVSNKPREKEFNSVSSQENESNLKHKKLLSILSSELRLRLENTKYRAISGPVKISLLDVKDNHHEPSPDIIVIEEGKKIPEIIVEVTTNETRSVDMVEKLALYTSCGIKEYWIVDEGVGMIMVHNFENTQLEGTQIFMKNQIIKSEIMSKLDIEVSSLFI